MTMLAAIPPTHPAHGLRELVEGLLEVYGPAPSPAAVDLWVVALWRAAEDGIAPIEAAAAIWLRTSRVPPLPADILGMVALTGEAKLQVIAADVAARHGVTVDVLRSPDRRKVAVVPRWEAMALARAEGFSMPEIGRFFGRDHTTVRHGLAAHAAGEAGR